MNTAVINIKTDPKVKVEAQKVAADLGLSLSTVLNKYLKEFVRTKSVHFHAENEGELTDYAKQALKESEGDYKNGRYLSFTPDEALAYLDRIIDEEKNKRTNRKNRVLKTISKTI